MADYARRIEELEQDRRKAQRQARRASERRRKALRRRQWAEARSALHTARINRRDAQEALTKIRVIRKHRKQASRAARLLRHRRSAGRTRDGRQLYWFDGRKVTAKIYPYLVLARKRGWKGRVTSGYRDPYYSMQLCYAMCGRPSCPGRCAGTSSNHVRDAVDLTDYGKFAAIMRSIGNPIYNALGARDPVHFSPNGR